MVAIAALQHKVFVKNVSLFKSDAVNDFDKQLLTESLFYPLFELNDGYVIAQTEFTPVEVYNDLTAKGLHIYVTFSTKASVLEAINNPPVVHNSVRDTVDALLRDNKITWEQAVLAVDNSVSMPDILKCMGLAVS